MRTGEKTKTLVRASDRLYRAKVKHYGLRTGTRRCSSLEVRLACTAGTQKACHGGGARLCGAVRGSQGAAPPARCREGSEGAAQGLPAASNRDTPWQRLSEVKNRGETCKGQDNSLQQVNRTHAKATVLAGHAGGGAISTMPCQEQIEGEQVLNEQPCHPYMFLLCVAWHGSCATTGLDWSC